MKRNPRFLLLLLSWFWLPCGAPAADAPFNGLDLNLGNLYRVSAAKTRSISPENFTGEKGLAGMSTEWPGPGRGPRSRPGLEDFTLRADRGQVHVHPG